MPDHPQQSDAASLLRELDDLHPQPAAAEAGRSSRAVGETPRGARGEGRRTREDGTWDRAARWLLACALTFAPFGVLAH